MEMIAWLYLYLIVGIGVALPFVAIHNIDISPVGVVYCITHWPSLVILQALLWIVEPFKGFI